MCRAFLVLRLGTGCGLDEYALRADKAGMNQLRDVPRCLLLSTLFFLLEYPRPVFGQAVTIDPISVSTNGSRRLQFQSESTNYYVGTMQTNFCVIPAVHIIFLIHRCPSPFSARETV
jgi:hypothetical protein